MSSSSLRYEFYGSGIPDIFGEIDYLEAPTGDQVPFPGSRRYDPESVARAKEIRKRYFKAGDT